MIRLGHLRKWICWVLIALSAGGILILGGQVWNARRRTPAVVARALASPGVVLEVDDLTPRQQEILLRVEDPNFYRHHGVDLTTPGAGLTTVTQSVVKKLYFEEFHPGLMKIKQTLIARYALDPLVDKKTQLKLFLNLLYFGRAQGRPVTGLAQAAQAYYHRTVRELSEDEYLSLVAMIIAPNQFNPETQPEASRDRVASIRRLLAGEYQPQGLMDLYYGGTTNRKERGALRGRLNRLIWGY